MHVACLVWYVEYSTRFFLCHLFLMSPSSLFKSIFLHVFDSDGLML